MKAHLGEIVQRGYAVDDEENDLGVRCISAPVFVGDTTEAIGCIGIDGPSVRVTSAAVADLAAIVAAAAAELSHELGAQTRRFERARGAS